MFDEFEPKNRYAAENLKRKLDGIFSQANDSHLKQQLHENRVLENKCKQCQQKVKVYKAKNLRSQLQIKQDLQKIEDVLYTLQRTKNRVGEIPNQIFESFDKLVQTEQTSTSEKMNCVRKGMIDDIDKKKKTMKTDAIEIIEQEFEQFCKTNSLTDIEKKVSILVTMLQQQRMNRQESAAELAQNIGEQILKMQHMMGQEREQRKKQNQSVLDFIGEIEDKLDRQLSEEVNLREKSETQVEGILEQLCMRIESKILGG